MNQKAGFSTRKKKDNIVVHKIFGPSLEGNMDTTTKYTKHVKI